MGNDMESKTSKSEKVPSPPVVDQPNVQVYPDWAAMQAYYGPRVAMPQFFNSAVVSSDHPPHPFMWGPPPQSMMPMSPYGVPYAAIYAHGGGIYGHAHPGGVPVQVQIADVETPNTKSSNNTEQGLVKKMKGFDGLAMSIGNNNADSSGDAGANRIESNSSETDGSSNGGSSGNTAGVRRNGNKKRRREETPTTVDGDGNTEIHKSEVLLGSKPTTRNVLQPCAIVTSETWLQNEKELKRERRKQSNRESARRSRLRKQAEAEELSKRVDSLLSDNSCLKSEIKSLREKSEKLKLENVTLSEKVKKGGISEPKSKAGVKLRQLLVNAVAGG
ncbi:G-box-binding factor 3-like isoform X3 [Impatiens glandulifera]|uniref:G-box-binding factor 3-like isoform X3 n=1 Tax=Impatiens glandulifera TaxID=253017 RepID=UPI001FB0534B|nr:G-box-binding factor 3-like isoform X3 [Impatiens glandulifera]